VTIYTIAYGSASDEALMEDIAEMTGGLYFYAPDDTTLEEAFETIGKSTNLKLSR
jgi:hypothetical protein